MGGQQLVWKLYNENIYRHPHFLMWYMKWHGYDNRIKSGEFAIRSKMDIRDLINDIVQGKVLYRKIIFIEGWTFKQMRKELYQDHNIKGLTKTWTDQQIMTKLGHPNEYPEGLFFPDTYFYTSGNTDLDILRKAYDEMQGLLTQQWPLRDSSLPYKTSYEALIVASLIEKETAVEKERTLISGVILNRLKKNMRLQIDPSVIYGLGGQYTGKITMKDLKTPNAYNIYLNKGLPPTPICMPSKPSILAALHPEKSNFLFYVARGDGSHIFSENYKEHETAIAMYLRPPALPRFPFHFVVNWFFIEYCHSWLKVCFPDVCAASLPPYKHAEH